MGFEPKRFTPSFSIALPFPIVPIVREEVTVPAVELPQADGIVAPKPVEAPKVVEPVVTNN